MSTSNQGQIKDSEGGYRDSIATIDKSGHRAWIFPKKPKGRFYNRRTVVSWVLLAFFFVTPFIKIGDNPLLLLNIFDRQFIIFGILFTPQDFHLLVLAMLTSIIFIILFTVIYGRVFCGWVCPQTIFLEMVYRKIEYLIEGTAKAQRKLKMAPWTAGKIFKRLFKHAIFIVIALLVINTFAAYLVGKDELFKMMGEPIKVNTGAFFAMLFFAAAFYFVFSWFREQVCIVACPYGRLQGVMLDKNSIVVAYDEKRGEPREKKRRKKEGRDSIAAAVAAGETLTVEEGNSEGDCIDCTLCVQVCPTGIDIRHGTQLECVNCTACIDACDAVMDKIDRPRGLIRFDSLAGMEEGRTGGIFTTRVKAYTAVLLLMVIGVSALLTSRTDVELLILKARGTLYNKVDETHISNLYNYEIINKTTETFPVEMKLIGDIGRIEYIGGNPPGVIEEGIKKGTFFIIVEKSKLKERKIMLSIEIYSNGKLIDKTKTSFLGPMR